MYNVYNIKFQQMIINSQRTASKIIDNLLHKVQKNINLVQRANVNKLKHSANKTSEVFMQLNDQIFQNFDESNHLKSPPNNNSLQFDSFMSVFNVHSKNNYENTEKSVTLTSNRLKRHASAQTQTQSARKKKKSSRPYDNIQSLDIPTPKVQYQDPHSQAIQDVLRNNLEVKLQKKLEQKKKTKKKLLSAQQLREVFTYDYQYNRVKVVKDSKPKLVNPLKSLLGKISKNVEKRQSAYKVMDPPNSHLKTIKIMEHQRKKQVRPKRQKNGEQQQQEQKQRKVEFSYIGTLTQRFDCQPGVVFSSQGQIFKNKKKLKVQDSKQGNLPLRLSKLDYMMLKQRSISSMTQLKQRSRKSTRIPKIIQSVQKQKQTELNMQQYTKNTIYYTKSTQKSNKQKISIQNTTMHQFLLSPDKLPLISNQNTSKTQPNQHQQNNQQQNSTIQLDDNDKFNISYIRGLVKPNKVSKNSQQNTTIPIQDLKNSRSIYIKVRQNTLSKKTAAIKELKRKFQQTLKQRQSRLTN